MPMISVPADLGLRAPLGRTPTFDEMPGTASLVGASFRQANEVVSMLSALLNSGPFTPVDGYSALPDIKGTDYFNNHSDLFAASASPAETASIKRRIDQEEADKRTLHAAGGLGVLTSMVGGTLSPTMLLPGRVAFGAVKEGAAFARGAREVGAAMAVQATAQESLLQASQETRTLGESAMNVASATILGALLGGTAVSLLAREGRFEPTVAAFERDRTEMAAHAENAPAPEPPVPVSAAPPLIPEVPMVGALESTVGAAASDTRNLTLVPTGIGLEKERTNPMSRLVNSPAVEARRAAVDLAEPTGRFATTAAERDAAGNLTGKTITVPEVTTAGPSLDRLAKMQINKTRVAVGDKLDELWKDLRFAGADAPWFARARDALGTLDRPPELPNYDGFKGLVSDAMRNGDVHEIPQVQEAAQYLRKTVFEPWKERAIKAGLLPEGIETKTADSYLQRIYNKQQIAAQRPEFVNTVQSWLVGDQAKKAEAQQRITAFHGALTVAQDQIKKTEARLAALAEDVEVVQARAEEATRLNKFAFQRSTTLRESEIGPRVVTPPPALDGRLLDRAKTVAGEPIDAKSFIAAGSGLEERAAVILHDGSIYEFPAAYGREGEWAGLGAHARFADETGGAGYASITGYSDKSAAVHSTEPLTSAQERTIARLRAAAKRNPEFELITDVPSKSASAEPGKNIEKARGGAVFETKVRDRGNVLSDQMSAKLAEIDALEQRLIRETASHDAMRAKIEAEIAAWEGKSTGEAKSALKARADAEARRNAKPGDEGYTRLASADPAIDTAVRRIIDSERDLSTNELRDRAHQITERILGSPDGRLPYDEAMGGVQIGAPRGGEPPRGPLAAREFNIPDALISKWLENDIERIVNTHMRTMVPDVLLTERFGDVAMTEAFRKIEDAYERLIDATKNERERTKLNSRRETDIRDLAIVRDRIRGVYGLDQFNAMRGAARTVAAVKNLNVLTSMGMATVSSLPDMAGAVFRHGLGNVFADAWVPFLRFMMGQGDEWKQAAKQFRAMGIATEMVSAQRHHGLNDIMDNYRPASRLERTLQVGADKFQFANMLAPWTDWGKINASMVASSEILRAAKAATERTATKRQIAQLAESGIDGHMAERIWGEFSRPGAGEVTNGVHLPNTDRWTNVSARDAFEGAVGREADIAIVTPGQEKPAILSQPVLGVIFQFKAFISASTQRILIANLQRADAQTLQGLIFSMGMGMVSYKLNSVLGGQPTSDRPQDWIKESLSRGGVFGWFEEGNALTSKMTRGTVDVYRLIGSDKPLSRYAGRSVLDQMLGPTAGKIEALAHVTGAAASRDWKESDTKALRKLTAFQNLFWLRGALNQVEAGANNAFGIPMKAPTQH